MAQLPVAMVDSLQSSAMSNRAWLRSWAPTSEWVKVQVTVPN